MAAPRFLLGDERALHDTALQFGPWRLTADLADHACANVRVPGSLQHPADHLYRKIADRSCMVALVLKVVDVVTASHDDMRPVAREMSARLSGLGLRPPQVNSTTVRPPAATIS